MNAISNIHAAGQNTTGNLQAARGPREISAAAAPKEAEKPEQQATSAASFEHRAKESAGQYWVEAAKVGAQIRFDKPTTASAQAQDVHKAAAQPERQNAPETQAVRSQAEPMEATEAARPTDEAEPNKSAAKREPTEKSDDGKEDPKQKSSTTTCNTDAVDRELEMLRAKAQKLEQSTRNGDEDAQAELEDVKRELAMKDNDAYRRAHAHFS